MSEQKETKPNFLLRRSLAVGSIVLAALGVNAIRVGIENTMEDNRQIDVFSQRDLINHPESIPDKYSEVTVYTAKDGDTSPDDAAKHAGAIDEFIVSREISGQAGGNGKLDIGDEFVLLESQLKKPAPSVKH